MFSYSSKTNQKFVFLLIVSLFSLSSGWAMNGKRDFSIMDDKKGPPAIKRGQSFSNITSDRGKNIKKPSSPLSTENEREATKTPSKTHIAPSKPLPSTPSVSTTSGLRKYSSPAKPSEINFGEKKSPLAPHKRGRSLPRIPVSKPLKGGDPQSNSPSPIRLRKKEEKNTPDKPSVEEKMAAPPEEKELKLKAQFEAFQNGSSSETPENLEKGKQTDELREGFEKALNYFKSLSSKKNNNEPLSVRRKEFPKRKSKSFILPRNRDLLDTAISPETDEPKDFLKSPRMQRLKSSWVLSSFTKRKGTPPTSPRTRKSKAVIMKKEVEETLLISNVVDGKEEEKKIVEEKSKGFTPEGDLPVPTINPVMATKHREASSVTLVENLVATEFLIQATKVYEKTGDIESKKSDLILQGDQGELLEVGLSMMRFADPAARGENGAKFADALRGQDIFLDACKTGFKWASGTLEDEGKKEACNSRLKEAQKKERKDKVKKYIPLVKKEEEPKKEPKYMINHPGAERKLRSRAKTIVGDESDPESDARNSKVRPSRAQTTSIFPPKPGSPRSPHKPQENY